MSPEFSLQRLTAVRDIVLKKGLAFTALEFPEGPLDPVRVRLSEDEFRRWRVKADRAGDVTVSREEGRDTALCVVLFGAQWFAIRCWWATRATGPEPVEPDPDVMGQDEIDARTEGAARDMVYGKGRGEG